MYETQLGEQYDASRDHPITPSDQRRDTQSEEQSTTATKTQEDNGKPVTHPERQTTPTKENSRPEESFTRSIAHENGDWRVRLPHHHTPIANTTNDLQATHPKTRMLPIVQTANNRRLGGSR